jgi:hypothetical protein
MLSKFDWSAILILIFGFMFFLWYSVESNNKLALEKERIKNEFAVDLVMAVTGRSEEKVEVVFPDVLEGLGELPELPDVSDLDPELPKP